MTPEVSVLVHESDTKERFNNVTQAGVRTAKADQGTIIVA